MNKVDIIKGTEMFVGTTVRNGNRIGKIVNGIKVGSSGTAHAGDLYMEIKCKDGTDTVWWSSLLKDQTFGSVEVVRSKYHTESIQWDLNNLMHFLGGSVHEDYPHILKEEILELIKTRPEKKKDKPCKDQLSIEDLDNIVREPFMEVPNTSKFKGLKVGNIRSKRTGIIDSIYYSDDTNVIMIAVISKKKRLTWQHDSSKSIALFPQLEIIDNPEMTLKLWSTKY